MFSSAARKIRLINCSSAKNPVKILVTGYKCRYFQQNCKVSTPVYVEDTNKFMEMLPSVITDLKDFTSAYDKKEVPNWIEKIVKYNVGNGKNRRGLLTVLAFKQLASESQLNVDNIEKAQRLGWCVELLTGAVMVIDDIMDGSSTRRRKPCWYTLGDVGMQAVNDSMLIENGVYFILEKYFSNTHYYTKLQNMFREASFLTCVGQTIDMQTSKENISKFSRETYQAMTRCKSSYGTFSLPISLAMQLCDISDPELFTKIENILFEICYYFQAHNDMVDCYGDLHATEGTGIDIETNRCTWLAVTALEMATSRQKKILQDNYGYKDPFKVAQVMQVYRELELTSCFSAYEEVISNHILTMISNVKCPFSDIILKIWDVYTENVSIR